jgi:hypothetical protein
MLMEILAVLEKFPKDNCVVSLQSMEKKFLEIYGYFTTDVK